MHLLEEGLGRYLAKQKDTYAVACATAQSAVSLRYTKGGNILGVAVVGRLGHCLKPHERNPGNQLVELTSAKYTPYTSVSSGT